MGLNDRLNYKTENFFSVNSMPHSDRGQMVQLYFSNCSPWDSSYKIQNLTKSKHLCKWSYLCTNGLMQITWLALLEEGLNFFSRFSGQSDSVSTLFRVKKYFFSKATQNCLKWFYFKMIKFLFFYLIFAILEGWGDGS